MRSELVSPYGIYFRIPVKGDPLRKLKFLLLSDIGNAPRLPPKKTQNSNEDKNNTKSTNKPPPPLPKKPLKAQEQPNVAQTTGETSSQQTDKSTAPQNQKEQQSPYIQQNAQLEQQSSSSHSSSRASTVVEETELEKELEQEIINKPTEEVSGSSLLSSTPQNGVFESVRIEDELGNQQTIISEQSLSNSVPSLSFSPPQLPPKKTNSVPPPELPPKKSNNNNSPDTTKV